jgi:hypothetical protein
MKLSADATALWHVDAECSTHVSITSLNPASLPPTVMLTSVVAELSAPSCPDATVAVVAPEHAANVNELVPFAAAHSFG